VDKKKWTITWSAVLGAFVSALVVLGGGEDYGPTSVDVLYMQDPGITAVDEGRVIAYSLTPGYDGWSEAEQGKTTAAGSGARLSVVTFLELEAADFAGLTTNPQEYVVDCATAPTGVEYTGE